MHIARIGGVLSGVIFACVFACGPTLPDSGAPEGSSGSGSSSTDTTTSTGATSSMSSLDATTDAVIPTSSSGATESEGTTGGAGADLPALQGSCQAFCATALECLKPNPYPDLASCMWLCVDSFDPAQPTCVAANIEANTCMAGLECPAFIEVLSGGAGGLCSGSLAAIEETCLPGCERAFVDGGPSTCSIGQTCPGQTPVAYECNGATCVCKVDGEPQKECAAEGACGEGWEAQAMAANACCGFEL